MMQANNQTTTQINIADEQRNAGNNFYECHIQHINDPKVLMLSLPEKELDQLSIENGRHFQYRFGRDLNHNIRKKIITLKQQYHWTDPEVRKLLVTGGIRVNRRTDEVTLYRERYSYYSAWVLIAATSAYYTMLILLMSSASTPEAWRQVLAQFMAASMCAATLWVFNWMFISPYHLLQRTYRKPITG
ncbi:MAG: hypothetical protein CVU29_11895 [Betaproteobacteria bacterium HGW-Betaproteobacteria-22]|nr:MAG: hypothetical protein CVU29_11895 [Betaproteobacteria bacterium HGW-Betaproteobacteria-22]